MKRKETRALVIYEEILHYIFKYDFVLYYYETNILKQGRTNLLTFNSMTLLTMKQHATIDMKSLFL